jgi:AraC family transcriptional regulator, arabinose operon regulatory protein
MDHRIQAICSELQSDPSRRLRITDLTQVVNLSPSRLQHLFKAETGRTLARYLKAARMEKARLLLDSTFLSVKEIMHSVGISSESHFARDFRKASGLSPTEYRARRRESILGLK